MLVIVCVKANMKFMCQGQFFGERPLYCILCFIYFFYIFRLCIYVFCWNIHSEALIENCFLDQALDKFIRSQFYCKLMESKLMVTMEKVIWIIVFFYRTRKKDSCKYILNTVLSKMLSFDSFDVRLYFDEVQSCEMWTIKTTNQKSYTNFDKFDWYLDKSY